MNRTNRKQRQRKIARLSIVSKYFKQGLSYRAIAKKVSVEIGYNISKSAIGRDIKTLLNEWREWKINENKDLTALELERIDETVKILWQEWELSKTPKTTTSLKRDGLMNRNVAYNVGKSTIVNHIQEIEAVKQPLGNVQYITEIRRQLQERRRLLGLYASDKQSIKTYILPINDYLYNR